MPSPNAGFVRLTTVCALASLLAACNTGGQATLPRAEAAPEKDAASTNVQAPAVQRSIEPVAEVRSVRREDEARRVREPVAAAKAAIGGIAVPTQSFIAAAPAPAASVWSGTPESNERYQGVKDSGVVLAADQPFSTFSIDVDTGSYANVRRFLNGGRLPPQEAVRVEELINYFPYRYAEPPRSAQGPRAPFGVTTELAVTPWNADSLLLRVGVKAFDQARTSLPPANLVFLVDVSGSMNSPDKLPLLKNALRLAVDKLPPGDSVSLVTYADGTQIVLPPTPAREKAKILAAIGQLRAGGSTAGEAGIQLAYQMAQQGYRAGGINRILLATDGDFNVGISDFGQLESMVEEKRRSGVSLSTLGFGTGNYREDLMELLADAGDGNYSYIDTLNEAQKVLVDEAASTYSIVARDVKIQMEFNPGVVAEYRLVGYENRTLAREDFRNDKVDAGEIGAGHSVTALYEVSLKGRKGLLGDSRYGKTQAANEARFADELGTLRLRYKAPAGGASREQAFAVGWKDAPRIEAASEDLRFAAAVAAFGQQLRGGKYLGEFDWGKIEALARGARGEDSFGYRGEFLRMVRLAQSLSTPAPQAALQVLE